MNSGLNHPHVCPVCMGKGTVPPGFYVPDLSNSTSAAPEQCRSCKGVGYIWDTPLPKIIKMHSPRIYRRPK